MVFWQNIISPHQMDLLAELAKNNKVTLVVEQEIDEQRISQAWSTIVDKNIILIVKPSLMEIINLIKNNKSRVHFISGFFSYKLMTLVLFFTAFIKFPVYIISEAVESDTRKGKIKLKIRSFFAYFFKNKVKGIFATGKRSVDYFIKLGFTQERIHDYGYFVNINSRHELVNESVVSNIIFVGRLVQCKGINKLLESFSTLKETHSNYTLKIIGSGPLEKSLKEQAVSIGLTETDVTFTKNMPRNQVLTEIEKADLLVLPNVSDEGWGVVVNESLLLGTPVICSHFTGASVIINPKIQGKVIDVVNANNLVEAILNIKKYDRKSIIVEAQKRLLPSVISNYLLDIVAQKETAFTPWYK